jgi:hypothetical protein
MIIQGQSIGPKEVKEVARNFETVDVSTQVKKRSYSEERL